MYPYLAGETLCRSPFDPFEDTEGFSFKPLRTQDRVVAAHSIRSRILKVARGRLRQVPAPCRSPFDPFEDTEGMMSIVICASRSLVAAHSIRSRILKDDIGNTSTATGVVAAHSIRSRILKGYFLQMDGSYRPVVAAHSIRSRILKASSASVFPKNGRKSQPIRSVRGY